MIPHRETGCCGCIVLSVAPASLEEDPSSVHTEAAPQAHPCAAAAAARRRPLLPPPLPCACVPAATAATAPCSPPATPQSLPACSDARNGAQVRGPLCLATSGKLQIPCRNASWQALCVSTAPTTAARGWPRTPGRPLPQLLLFLLLLLHCRPDVGGVASILRVLPGCRSAGGAHLHAVRLHSARAGAPHRLACRRCARAVGPASVPAGYQACSWCSLPCCEAAQVQA